MSNVDIRRRKSDPMVHCEDCEALRPEATRERARQHAVKNGHTVRVLIEDVTTYKAKDGAS